MLPINQKNELMKWLIQNTKVLLRIEEICFTDSKKFGRINWTSLPIVGKVDFEFPLRIYKWNVTCNLSCNKWDPQ